jgi:hypothetical protein
VFVLSTHALSVPHLSSSFSHDPLLTADAISHIITGIRITNSANMSTDTVRESIAFFGFGWWGALVEKFN